MGIRCWHCGVQNTMEHLTGSVSVVSSSIQWLVKSKECSCTKQCPILLQAFQWHLLLVRIGFDHLPEHITTFDPIDQPLHPERHLLHTTLFDYRAGRGDSSVQDLATGYDS